MNDPRPVVLLDGELRTLVSLQRDAADQLASVRRQMTELLAHEWSLCAAVELRARRIDSLLDQRNVAQLEAQVTV